MNYTEAINEAAKLGVERSSDPDAALDIAVEHFLEIIDKDDPYDSGGLQTLKYDLERAITRHGS